MKLTKASLKATLGPWVAVIKPAAALVAAVIIFVGGCDYGKSKQAAEVVSLTAQVATLKSANQSYYNEADERNKMVEGALAESEELMKAGSKADKVLAKERIERVKKQARREVLFQRALEDPKCADVLEMEVCDTVPLP